MMRGMKLVNQGVPREEAIYIRNAVTDIDLNSSPEVCAEYEISKTLRRKR